MTTECGYADIITAALTRPISSQQMWAYRYHHNRCDHTHIITTDVTIPISSQQKWPYRYYHNSCDYTDDGAWLHALFITEECCDGCTDFVARDSDYADFTTIGRTWPCRRHQNKRTWQYAGYVTIQWSYTGRYSSITWLYCHFHNG